MSCEEGRLLVVLEQRYLTHSIDILMFKSCKPPILTAALSPSFFLRFSYWAP